VRSKTTGPKSRRAARADDVGNASVPVEETRGQRRHGRFTGTQHSGNIRDYVIQVHLPPPDPDAVGRLARLLVEQATAEVFNRVAGVEKGDAAETGIPAASRETVHAHHRPEEE